MNLNLPEHIILLFIDGIGVGHRDGRINPCAHPGLLYFDHFIEDTYPKIITDNCFVTSLDANLGIKGLPQSATGQTALLTGINASRELGRHLNGFPNQKLRDIIARHSILKKITEMGHKAAFLNSFRPPFFDYDPNEIVRYLSVTSVTNLYAGLPFFNLDDLLEKKSVYQDLTNRSLIDKGFNVPLYTPEEAGTIVGSRIPHYAFSLFEYFQTDRAGHSMDLNRALSELFKLERFLSAVLTTIDEQKTLIVVTSDHGNIEDISRKGHTRHKVMCLFFGAVRSVFGEKLESITDISPLVLRLLRDGTENS
ncbi:alkaline phosphatase [candidate division KSB1 bacterium]|nr:alkaline phosphatase [candidate division KSB1 bacterium]